MHRCGKLAKCGIYIVSLLQTREAMVDFLENYGKTQGFTRRRRHKKRKRLRRLDNTFQYIAIKV